MGRFIRRYFFFFLTNIMVMLTISLVVSLFGLNRYMTPYGIDYPQLMGFCLIWGFSGAFISLWMSRWMAKRAMGVQVIDPNSPGQFGALVQDVHELAKRANIEKMPEVGIYDSPEINAFATGPTRNRALVAVSTGLLQRMSREEVHGVLGHEVAHITNGDMVTMTLVQGVVNAFVMFFARALAFAISQAVDSRSRNTVHFVLIMLFEVVFSVLGMIVVAYVSRRREFRADEGGAMLAGKHEMVAALQGLKRQVEERIERDDTGLATMKISGRTKKFLGLFATHPPLDVRIATLQKFEI